MGPPSINDMGVRMYPLPLHLNTKSRLDESSLDVSLFLTAALRARPWLTSGHCFPPPAWLINSIHLALSTRCASSLGTPPPPPLLCPPVVRFSWLPAARPCLPSSLVGGYGRKIRKPTNPKVAVGHLAEHFRKVTSHCDFPNFYNLHAWVIVPSFTSKNPEEPWPRVFQKLQ